MVSTEIIILKHQHLVPGREICVMSKNCLNELLQKLKLEKKLQSTESDIGGRFPGARDEGDSEVDEWLVFNSLSTIFAIDQSGLQTLLSTNNEQKEFEKTIYEYCLVRLDREK
ncbi:hypothetical protein WN944_013712 [Citrus x changshan-huyou]|uniref:Uncharacterized protein n=1 Tax=Citrus x changshan-huyou TaxID=2935761 RepID=A0AAP0M5P4_9ROSI